MSSSSWRWILAPRTSWLAWRVWKAHQDKPPFGTAWTAIRLTRHPDEIFYQAAGQQRNPSSPCPSAPHRGDT